MKLLAYIALLVGCSAVWGIILLCILGWFLGAIAGLAIVSVSVALFVEADYYLDHPNG